MKERKKMPGNEATEFGRAEVMARLAVIRAEKKAAAEAAKPKVVATVSPKMAEAIKANPGTLRVSAKGADETVVVDRPRRTEMLEVLEVDREGRPARVARLDCATGERSVLEYVGGYRQPIGAVSVYDPFAELKGNEND
jgi:hypothetical protein